jgi:hypothetical protein
MRSPGWRRCHPPHRSEAAKPSCRLWRSRAGSGCRPVGAVACRAWPRTRRRQAGRGLRTPARSRSGASSNGRETGNRSVRRLAGRYARLTGGPASSLGQRGCSSRVRAVGSSPFHAMRHSKRNRRAPARMHLPREPRLARPADPMGSLCPCIRSFEVPSRCTSLSRVAACRRHLLRIA